MSSLWKPIITTSFLGLEHLHLAMLLLLLLIFPSMEAAWSPLVSRRSVLHEMLAGSFVLTSSASAQDNNVDTITPSRSNYPYSDTWTGTALPLLDLTQASSRDEWNMGRWPDPILRRPASPVDPSWFGTDTLFQATRLLQQTSRQAKAVGLAAQQCGVDARIVYLEEFTASLVMVNPHIIHRSDEQDMVVWREHCLVLPPSFQATVLRDAWIDVEYRDWQGRYHQTRLKGETARAAQHELDHDGGILILDHVSLDEMENERMQAMEIEGHDERMALAYSRAIEEPSDYAV